MLDLEPATSELARLIGGIADDQLSAPTPCAQLNLGDLLDHVDGLALAFAAAARKDREFGSQPPPPPDGAGLGPAWRERLPARLADLAGAWSDERAWTGPTCAGGIDMDGGVTGLVALDEIVVHGWDIAVASGQRYEVDPSLLAAVFEFVDRSVRQNPQGTPGVFDAPVPTGADASLLHQLIGRTGRDPGWTPRTRSVTGAQR